MKTIQWFYHFNLQPSVLAELIKLTEEGKVNFSVASSKILPVLIEKMVHHWR
jgi:hypothetical protein